MSHQNSATSLILMEDKRVSQMSNLNMFPMTTSIGVPTTLLSSITVRSSSHSWVRKWKVTWSRKSTRHHHVTHCSGAGSQILFFNMRVATDFRNTDMFTLLQLIECALTKKGKYDFHLRSSEQFTVSIILCWQPAALAPDLSPSSGNRAVKLVRLVRKMKSINMA